jgi:hypothetical protein
MSKIRVQLYIDKKLLEKVRSQGFNSLAESDNECIRNALKIIVKDTTIYYL